ncbi:4-amino-4-deoxy-L-arabinose transferase-like glycosyltransferase [Saccharothrix tamanrassetensis]|uniref:4-amino-4-deoxy-L-arabinose transferase-like glycosyltransferase n=1 Tax=Saccharothrix tamanrassetensis TaxID=1051531 RepID=A0A841CNY2_9PSEU|nr:hypothetical protein [Saccharothrix tamanrassetensis]MBB5960162.1 4-amino-4-deoxy-L-arabinose transferase-like glycosyltransferase [Saccharothrix tamanrassetensis]
MTFLLRFGAVFGVLSGVLIVVTGAAEAFLGETLPTSLVIGLSPALALPLITALQLTQLHRADRFTSIAFAVNVVGLGLFGGAAYALNIVLFPLDVTPTPSTGVVLLASALVFAVGTALFAAAMLRAKVHPRVAVWIYAVALPVLAIAARLPDSPVTSGVHVLAGGSLIWLAVSVYSLNAVTSSIAAPEAKTSSVAPSSSS